MKVTLKKVGFCHSFLYQIVLSQLLSINIMFALLSLLTLSLLLYLLKITLPLCNVIFLSNCFKLIESNMFTLDTLMFLLGPDRYIGWPIRLANISARTISVYRYNVAANFREYL